MSTSVPQSLPAWRGRLAGRGIPVESSFTWPSVYFRDPDGIFLSSLLPGFGRSIRSLVGLEIELAFARFARIVAMSDCFQRGLSISDQPD